MVKVNEQTTEEGIEKLITRCHKQEDTDEQLGGPCSFHYYNGYKFYCFLALLGETLIVEDGFYQANIYRGWKRAVNVLFILYLTFFFFKRYKNWKFCLRN